MCVILHGLSDNLIVLDPFCGIGSTDIACKRLGISFIGFDIDTGYLDEAIARVTKESIYTSKTSNITTNNNNQTPLEAFNT